MSFNEQAQHWATLARDMFAAIRRGHARGYLLCGLVLLVVAAKIADWLPRELSELFDSTLEWIAFGLGLGGLLLIGFGLHKIWKLTAPATNLTTDEAMPDAVKGPTAFAEADGDLFLKLGRHAELAKLLGYVRDDQAPLVVVMGASGAGKTSLLRAGLSRKLQNDDAVCYHYWEATSNEPDAGLLHAIQARWSNIKHAAPPPEKLDDLLDSNTFADGRRHVVVLDQFEQLRGRDFDACPIFTLLRKTIREVRPPHHVTWVVAFRREYRADWQDFILAEHEYGFYPHELSMRLFTKAQCEHELIPTLIDAAGLKVQRRVVTRMVETMAVDGEVSPVDVGIGLQVLAQLHRRLGRDVSANDYRFAGGHEGLLLEYMREKLNVFGEVEREKLFQALLALTNRADNQRVAEGLVCPDLAKVAESAEARLRPQLDYLANPNVRLLEKRQEHGESQARYRLPHDRLVPVLFRLTGDMLSPGEQAKLKFDTAYGDWLKYDYDEYFLLKGRDLRLVLAHRDAIVPGAAVKEKNTFLKRSLGKRNAMRVGMVIVAALFLYAYLSGDNYVDRQQRERVFEVLGYPIALDDAQSHLKSLTLYEPIDLGHHEHLAWLNSDSIESLTLKATRYTARIDGLVELAELASLRRLILDLNGSKVSTLSGLEKLINLKQLTLDLNNTNINSLTPLEKLINLQELTLKVNGRDIIALPSLEKLTQLRELTLELNGTSINSLAPLEELVGLQQLKLEVHGLNIAPLPSLKKLSTLKQLTLVVSQDMIDTLPSFEKLTNLNQLTIDVIGSSIETLPSLEKLTNLKQLNLDLNDFSLSGLTGLDELTNMRQLTLKVRGLNVALPSLDRLTNLRQLALEVTGTWRFELSSLNKLTNLQQLTLSLGLKNVNNLPPFEQLTNLKQLTINFFDPGVTMLVLEKLPNVTQLTLDLSGVILRLTEQEKLAYLSNLTNLQQLTLDLRSAQIETPSVLEKLTGLQQLTLNLGGTKIETLPALEKLTSLVQLTLSLDGTMIATLPSLEKLTGLQHLTLDLNASDVTTLPALEKLPGLKQLSLDLVESKITALTDMGKFRQLKKLDLKASRSVLRSIQTLPKSLEELAF